MTTSLRCHLLSPAVAAAVLLAAGGCNRAPSSGAPQANGSPAAAPGAAPGDGAAATESALPPGHPPLPSGTAAPAGPVPPADPKVAEFLGLRGPKPATWTWVPPESSMRAANWVVPAAGEGDQAHVVVFQGIGGGRDANISRWVAQFRPGESGPVEPTQETFTVGDMTVTLVELRGDWMKMGEQWYTEQQLFLGVVLEAPGQPEIYIRFAGDAPTVEANREAFLALVRGLERIPS